MARRSLYYTFGNHMHWVDMQWLWGYDVLPGCIDDMLRLIEATGAKGNVNFDGVGYEKLASEAPASLLKLREAIVRGEVEPVGCTYGQPYGLFHDGESNIRQFQHGIASVQRLLGVRPRTFWEEEFYFFPQLPQLLAQCGYTGASLFFQWTWHTPEVPVETTPLILWEGVDGSRIPAAPRHRLNIHQWPEEFDGLLDAAASEKGAAAIVQWLELMPSRDWMCRSEVLLPRLQALLADPRFQIEHRTLGGMLEALAHEHANPPVRRYAMDDVWHGMTLGKNTDQHPSTSRAASDAIRKAEVISVLASFAGRPYPRWDVYPSWELDEAWRQLLIGQHHDNHECEGLCGSVGSAAMHTADVLSRDVYPRAHAMLLSRSLEHVPNAVVVMNQLGWRRDVALTDHRGFVQGTCSAPPFSWSAQRSLKPLPKESLARQRGGDAVLSRAGFSVRFATRHGPVAQVTSADFPSGVFEPGVPFGSIDVGDRVGVFTPGNPTVSEHMRQGDQIEICSELTDGCCSVTMESKLHIVHPAVTFRFILLGVHHVGPGIAEGISMPIALAGGIGRIIADTPYAAYEVGAGSRGRRKYPEGDWMTSPQWYESIEGAFTSLSWVDLLHADNSGRGVFIAHEGHQQFFREGDRVRWLLHTQDPWDAENAGVPTNVGFVMMPHGPLSNAQRARLAAELLSGPIDADPASPEAMQLPLAVAEVHGADNVILEHVFRQCAKDGEHLPNWAGHALARKSDGACTHPIMLRLVEWDGKPADIELRLAGPVAAAAKTTVLGEVIERRNDAARSGWSAADTAWLTPVDCEAPEWSAPGARWQSVRFTMRPHEIATVMVDLVPARKTWRDLDVKREVWARAHRTEAAES